MPYNATVSFSYINDTETSHNKYFPEILDKQTIIVKAPASDLNVYQYYELFKGFLRAVGFSEYSIADGSLRLSLSDENDSNQTKKLMEEYDLQDKQYFTTEDYHNLQDKCEKLQEKLSRLEDSNKSEYTDEKLDSIPMFVESSENIEVTKETLCNAYKVCNECGTKYGKYSVGCSSHWMAKCDVCGEGKSVTEARDYGFLKKGIEELSK